MATGLGARLTVQGGKVIKIEKAVPRSRREQYRGLTDPKYVDAVERDPRDRFYFQAAHDKDVSSWLDGEYVGVVQGPEVAGSPKGLERVVFQTPTELPPTT